MTAKKKKSTQQESTLLFPGLRPRDREALDPKPRKKKDKRKPFSLRDYWEGGGWNCAKIVV